MIANSVDTGIRLPESTQAHIRNCPACRERYERETELARQLAASAAAQRKAASAFLHGRIMASIASSKREVDPGPMPRRLAWLAALATVCIFAAILSLHHSSRESAEPKENVAGNHSNAESPAGLLLREWSARLDQPLQTEMTLVVSDAKGAMNSLAANFLPEQFRSSLSSQAQN